MSAVIPFPVALARQARDTLAGYVAQASKPTDARTLFVRATIRGHCHVRHYSEAVMGQSVRSALTQVANGQTQDYAIHYGCELADRLHKAEVDDAWSDAR